MTIWYVRPEGGSYGLEDGTEYDDAWDGLHEVVWGVGGVVAGDTLYICGLHIWEMTSLNNTTTQADVGPLESGSSGNSIIIRGDYGGDAGYVWGAYKASYDVWSLESGSTYSIPINSCNTEDDFFFEDITSVSWVLLDPETTIPAVEANPGSVFRDTSTSKIYVHCSDDGDPTGRIYFPSWGYDFKMDGKSYITFQDLEFYVAGSRMFFTRRDNESADNITWNNCTIWYWTCLEADQYSSYLVWDNCDIAWYTAGVDLGRSSNNIIRNCYMHDIGVRESIYSSDSHGVAVNGGSNNLLEHNECYNCGTGITFYVYASQDAADNVIRWNYIHDMHNLGGAPSRGLEFNGQEGEAQDRSGNKIYGNIVARVNDHAYRTTVADVNDEVVFYNNIAYDSDIAFYFNNTQETYGCYVKMRNNISHTVSTCHIYMGCFHAQGNYRIDSDYNCFYPDGVAFFRLKDSGGQDNCTFAQWKALSKTGCTFDPNSLLTDPLFLNGNGDHSDDTDFKLKPDSLCRNAGVDVGLTQDYFGYPIPSGAGFDIGISEYQGNAFSDYVESATLAHIFKNTSFPQPTNLYVALCKSTITDDDTGSTLPGEISGGSYARKQCNTWDTSGTPGYAKNDLTLSFAEATAEWGDITNFAVCDAITGGNMICYGRLSFSKHIHTGDLFTVKTEDLSVGLN